MIQIIIADDHQMIRDAWALILSKDKRFKIIGRCGDSVESVNMSRKLRPDILLLDINMSPFNGIEITQKIRKVSPGTGIIAITMYNHPFYAQKMLKLGAMGYVTKSSPMEEISKAILDVSDGRIYICKEMKEILLETKSNQTEFSPLKQLTEREIEVITLIKDGLSSKEIGEKLDIAIKTVETHRYNIAKKLKVKNAISLIHLMNDGAVYI